MNKRCQSITLRVSLEERIRLAENASRCGLSLSAYLRLVGLYGEDIVCKRFVNQKE